MYLEPPKGTVGLAIFRSANGEFLASGHQVANNKLVVLPDGCGVDVVAPDLCGSDDIALSQARLNELSEVLCLTSVQPAKLTVIDGNPERLQLLRKAIVEQVAHPQPDPQGETVCNLVAQMVAWIGDACCPAGKELKNGNPKKARVARLVRDFIEDNYRYPVRLEDLCRETGVSVRTLQRSFREYFNLTITDYLRALRLNEAQRALRRAEPSGNSVTRIALHHGFTHLGRFSVEYRHNFGESPKETLAA
jgi:AraC-like DNA-binding protein